MIHGKDITPEIRNDFAGQIDVAPTILGLLGIDYTQNNFGIDLNKEKRPYAFYTTDKHIAARDSSRLYIYEPSENLEFFYSLVNGELLETECDSTYQEMRNYCFSMLQSAQFLAKNKLTVDKEEEKANK
jgi:phosphoglycerol transferase MdoB-like AlkP superfamily enzyme